jgi:hypothetical protein
MRFHAPEVGGIVPELQQMMEKALIQSYNIYLVYGYYDVFVRVWTTPQKWTRLMRLMSLSLSPRLASQQEYHIDIDHMVYLWAPRHSNRTPKPESYRKLIQEVSSKDRSNDLVSDDPDVVELVRAGVLHLLEEEPAGSIKFYVLLSRYAFRFPSATEYDELRRILIEGNIPYVRKPSIYRVTGGGEYFLKFVVNNYDEVLPVISVLTLATKDFGLRTMTLLISNANAPEADIVDPEWEDFPSSLFQVEDMLRESSSSIGIDLARLDFQTRLHVASTFDNYRSLMHERLFSPMFEGFFLARAEQDIQMLSEKLNWITHLEALLRIFLKNMARKELKDEWYKLVRSTAQEVRVKEPQKPEQYTLRETVNVLSKLVKEEKLPAAEVERGLGSDWERRIRGLTEPFAKGLEIRNNLAHGTLYDRADQYWANWTEVAERVFDAAAIYVQLRKEQGSQSTDDTELTT